MRRQTIETFSGYESCQPSAIAYKVITMAALLTINSGVNQEVLSKDTGAMERKGIVYKYVQGLAKGSLVDGSLIRGARVAKAQIPVNAVDDGNIVLGRKVLRTVGAGEIIVLNDCFTPQELRLAPRIDVLQGTHTMRHKVQADTTKDKVKALFCRRKIRAGQILELADLTLKLVPVANLPASQAVNIWTVVKRRASHNLEIGERLMLEDMIPVEQMSRYKESLSKS